MVSFCLSPPQPLSLFLPLVLAPLFSRLFLLATALQTRPVHRQRARRHAGGGGVGSVESLRYLFADVRRGHQDRRARVQPARVSSRSFCSHACLLELVSILAAGVSVP